MFLASRTKRSLRVFFRFLAYDNRFEQDLRARHEAEMQRLQAEEDKLLAKEREAQEARMKEKKARNRKINYLVMKTMT